MAYSILVRELHLQDFLKLFLSTLTVNDKGTRYLNTETSFVLIQHSKKSYGLRGMHISKYSTSFSTLLLLEDPDGLRIEMVSELFISN